MSTVARFETERIELTPGVQTTQRLTVANQSQIVEAYRFEPVGELAPFTRVTPEQLSLYPNTEGTATLTFSLPRESPVPAGEVPFAVMVRPQEQADDLLVPEATAIVLPYSRIEAELTPRTSQARLWGKHFLALDNRGNHQVEIRLSGTDPNDALVVRCRPGLLTVRPGQAVFAKVRVRPRRPMWRGQPTTRPFQLAVRPDETDEADEFPVDGQVILEPIFPRGTGKLLAALAVAAVALVALWFGVLRPTITSTAQDAVSKPLQQVKKQAAQAQQQAKQASQQAELASGKSVQASKAASKSAAEQANASAVQPLNKRLLVSADPKNTATATFVVPGKQVVSVTDLVFESRGDAGTVQLLRDDDELITAQTEDFRTLDQHFVSPIIYPAGQKITFRLACRQPVQGEKKCQAGLYVGGEQQPVPPPPAKPSPAKSPPAKSPPAEPSSVESSPAESPPG